MMLTVLFAVSVVALSVNVLLIAKLYALSRRATRGVRTADSTEQRAELSGTHVIDNGVGRGSRVNSEGAIQALKGLDDPEDEPTRIHPSSVRKRRSA
jgi:hypothetical protein